MMHVTDFNPICVRYNFEKGGSVLFNHPYGVATLENVSFLWRT